MPTETGNLTKEDLVRIFTRWNQQAAEGGWSNNPPNPELSAEQFLLLATELKEGAN